MAIYTEQPPTLSGTPAEQLQQLHSYLYRLVSTLNAVGNIGAAGGGGDAGTLLALSKSFRDSATETASTISRLSDRITETERGITSLQDEDETVITLINQLITQIRAMSSSISDLQESVNSLIDAVGNLQQSDTDFSTWQAGMAGAITTSGSDAAVGGTLSVGGVTLSGEQLTKLLALIPHSGGGN